MKRPIPQRLLTIIILSICVVINLPIRQISLRLDLSNGQAYSISSASKKIVNKLSKPIVITFFTSKNIPSPLLSVRQEIDDFLKEYSAQTGRKKISYILKNPDNDTKAQQELQNYNIPRLQFSQQDQDQFALQNAYFGIGIAYDKKYASLPQVTDIRDLEYNLSSVLYKLSNSSLPKVGVMGQSDGLTQLQSLVTVSQSQFSIEETASARAEFKTVIVFGTDAKQYTQEEVEQMQQYIKDGGTVLFFVDGVTVNESLVTQEAAHGLFGLLRSMGVELNKNLVLSKAAELVSFGVSDSSQGSLPTVLPYSYWIKTNEFAKQSVFSNVTALVFPWSSSVEVSKNKGVLVKSEPQSWVETKDYDLNPQTKLAPKKVREQAFPLVVSGTYGKGKFIVIPSSRFVQDGFLSRTNDNMELVMNILSEYTSGGVLSGIRSRSVEYYPLPPLAEPIKNVVKYFQIFAGPVVFALLGLAILIKRSRSK